MSQPIEPQTPEKHPTKTQPSATRQVLREVAVRDHWTRDFRLGRCVIHPATAEIAGPQGMVRVEPKSMAVLLELTRHAGEVCPRQAILDVVWGDVFVGEEALTHCIWELRRALGDEARQPRYIKTLTGRGYSLIATVTPLDQRPTMTTVVALAPRGTGHGDLTDPTDPAAILAQLAETRCPGMGVRWVEPTLVLVDLPVDAVRLALDCQRWMTELVPGARLGVGIHLGEATLDEFSGSHCLESPTGRPRPVVGPAFEIASALRDLARPGQILVTRGTFDLTREGSLSRDFEEATTVPPGPTAAIAPRRPMPQWVAHGAYHLAGFEHPLRIYEVGVPGVSPLVPPPDSGTAVRIRGDGTIAGWRPALGQHIPGRANWRLTRHLGTGGHGEAWLAHQTKTCEARVFKFCYQHEGLSALRREVVIFRLLKDRLGDRDDITRLLDWQFDKEPFYLESEYSTAGDLMEWTDSAGGASAVALETRLELVAQCADALAAAHSVGVLHKDVKPNNILIRSTPDGRIQARLTDFGIGHIVERRYLDEAGISRRSLFGTTTAGVTEGSPSGTPLYRAPELLEGRPATHQTDIYALGVVLFQWLVGDLRRALAPGWERSIDDPELRQTLALAIDGDPRCRLADAGQLAERLRAHASQQSSGPSSLPQPQHRLVETRIELATVLLEVGQTHEAASQVELAVEALTRMPLNDPLRRRAETLRRRVAAASTREAPTG